MLVKGIYKIVMVFMLLVFFTACAPARKNGGEDLSYVKDAIRVSLSSTTDLNFYNNQSHTVVLIFYQLSEPNIFNQMLESPDGIVKLLEAKPFDASDLSRRSLVVQPGEFREVMMDRVQGARYIAAIAGYYSLKGPQISRVTPIKVESFQSFFWRKIDSAPKMQFNLRLGSDSFVKANPKQTQTPVKK